jgi:signal transduction histidine kinase
MSQPPCSLKILIVEDEWIIALDIKRHLSKLGYSVTGMANSAEKALDLVAQTKPDLVLMDIYLQGETTGIEASELIRQQFNLPIVFLTAHADETTLAEVSATHPQGYVVKPFEEQDLSIAIQLALANHRAEQAVQQALEKEKQLYALKLIHTGKMSSLGQLIASVAHEINNPVNFIGANLSHVDNYTQDLLALIDLYQQGYVHSSPEIQDKIEEIDLDFLKEDLPQILSSIKMGTERVYEIVLTLRNFSRLDETKMKAVNIHEGIDNTLLILRDRLKEKAEHSAISIIKEYGDLPLVECYAGQLNQVFMNILSNAIDVLCQPESDSSTEVIQNYRPTITIHTEVKNSNWVEISIQDNGRGMDESILERLFDPFFTTKEVGNGTGLGLSISYQIVVEKHGGKLQCISAPRQGAKFVIEIPIRQSS